MPTFSAATFRTVGNAATTQNLFSIFNAGASRAVTIRRLSMFMDATVVLTAVMPLVKTSRVTAAPAAGVAITKVAFNTANLASSSDIAVLGTCSTDGGALTAITGTPGDVMWQQYGMRLHTAVGQVLGVENNVLPCLAQPVVLQANEGLIVHIVAAAAGSNPATNHYTVGCVWDEDQTYWV